MSVLEGHRCEPSDNPRHHDTCRKCGRPMPADPGSRYRNLDLERETTREAARGAVDPSPLIEFSEARAFQPHGYGNVHQVRLGVDWLREARAEAADMRNYLCWFIEEHVGEERAKDAEIALRFLVLAYDRLLEDD